MKSNTKIRGKFDSADAAVEVTDTQIIVYRKSPYARLFFGAIGTAIASGKEACKFTADDVASYSVQEKSFRNIATFVFKDNSELEIDMSKEMVAAVNKIMS